jgi:hypothetical protein
MLLAVAALITAVVAPAALSGKSKGLKAHQVSAARLAAADPSAGKGATAWALVDPNGGSPRLVAGHSSGFSAVSFGPFGPGDYCLTPKPGVSVDSTAAVASERRSTRMRSGLSPSATRLPGPPVPPASWR